ncbi:MAG: PEP-CTERM sorting domain-containing protein [Mariniblastus sp.]
MKKNLTLLAKFSIAFSFALSTAFMTTPTVKADLAIGFSSDGTTFVDTFNVDVGQSITVQVFALETAETRLSDFGLQNVGTKASYSTGFGTVSDASIDTANFSNGGSGFDNGIPELDLVGFTFSPENNAASQIRLGTFTFDATAEGTTMFDFGDFDTNTSASNFTLGDGATDLDEDFFGAARTNVYTANIVSVATVPEPSGLAFLIIGASGYCLRRRGRSL